jgi:hypothetical protein
MSHMNDAQRAEAMYKMTPEQRAQTLSRMNPTERNSLLAPQARMNERHGEMMRAAGAVGALGAGAALRASHNETGAREMGQRGEEGSNRLGSAMHYRADARDIPRAGDARTGREGALDPGGYLRRTGGPSSVVNPAYARSQFGQHMPNYAALAAHNQANLIARNNWSWHLPPYSPGWFSGWNGPWSWNNNWYSGNNWGWWNGPGFWNGYYGTLPWYMRLMSLWPFGINSGLGWSPYMNDYSAYYWNGYNYPIDYYACNGYVPTQYVFSVPNGRYWNVGRGYTNSLPSGYHAPLTVAVKESVPQYNTYGQIVAYKFETFYYNAFWDSQAQAYGYYDYRQQFHLVNLPGLNTYSGAYPAGNAVPQYGPSQYAVPQTQPTYAPSQYAPQYGPTTVPQQNAPPQY